MADFGVRACTRPKLCSLSRLSALDDQLLAKLLNENDINCNDVNRLPDGWATILAANNNNNPIIVVDEEEDEDENDTIAIVHDRDQASCSTRQDVVIADSTNNETKLMHRVMKLFNWTSTSTSPSPTAVDHMQDDVIMSDDNSSSIIIANQSHQHRTIVDEFNALIVEQLLHQQVLPQTRMCKQLQWVRQVVGRRAAQSAEDNRGDCYRRLAFTTIDSQCRHDDDDDDSRHRVRSSTWPLIGIHLNYVGKSTTHTHSSYARYSENDANSISESESKQTHDVSSREEGGEWDIAWSDVSRQRCLLQGR